MLPGLLASLRRQFRPEPFCHIPVVIVSNTMPPLEKRSIRRIIRSGFGSIVDVLTDSESKCIPLLLRKLLTILSGPAVRLRRSDGMLSRMGRMSRLPICNCSATRCDVRFRLRTKESVPSGEKKSMRKSPERNAASTRSRPA